VADEVEWKRRPVYHDRFHGAAVITVAVPFCTRRRLQVPTASNTHQGAGTLITEFLWFTSFLLSYLPRKTDRQHVPSAKS
jgi:hypothetical protein